MTRIRPEDSARPWLPASDVRPLREYHVWNVPLAGLVEQGDSKYLFTCLFGEESDTASVWAYAAVSDQEIERLESPDGDEFADAVDAALANKALVVAFADDDKLANWHMIDAGEEGPAEILRRFLDRWKLSIKEQTEHAAEISGSSEMVDA